MAATVKAAMKIQLILYKCLKNSQKLEEHNFKTIRVVPNWCLENIPILQKEINHPGFKGRAFCCKSFDLVTIHYGVQLQIM